MLHLYQHLNVEILLKTVETYYTNVSLAFFTNCVDDGRGFTPRLNPATRKTNQVQTCDN